MYDIGFPNLGLWLENIKDGFSIGSFEIKFYGMIIACGFLLAYVFVSKEAERTGQNPEIYLDYLLWMIIPAILGARLYYVLFSASSFFKPGQGVWTTIKGIFNIRGGGLAIYGGVIAGILVLVIFAKKRKLSIPQMLDTAVMGLLIGQIMGRWGNFFNREAFGGYTDSLFAMAIPVSFFDQKGSVASLVSRGIITQEMVDHVVEFNGAEFIQVHPTFLYESVWNLLLLLIIFFYRKNKRFEGELFLMYLWGYGLGRVWIEGLRSDSLMIGGMKVSQLLAAGCVVVASVLIARKRLVLKRGQGESHKAS